MNNCALVTNIFLSFIEFHFISFLEQFPSLNDLECKMTKLKDQKIIFLTIDFIMHTYLNRQMVECCKCNQWFHRMCERIQAEVFVKKHVQWFCNECTKKN